MTLNLPRPAIISIPTFEDHNGLLVVPSAAALGFSLERFFCVAANKDDVRGHHAHRECTQLLVVISGAVLVTANNGKELFEFELDSPREGLLLPPLIWATQTYLAQANVLVVLCDQKYEESDYIRDYEDFLNEGKVAGINWRKEATQ